MQDTVFLAMATVLSYFKLIKRAFRHAYMIGIAICIPYFAYSEVRFSIFQFEKIKDLSCKFFYGLISSFIKQAGQF